MKTTNTHCEALVTIPLVLLASVAIVFGTIACIALQ